MREQKQWLFEAPYPSKTDQLERNISNFISQEGWLFEAPPVSVEFETDYMTAGGKTPKSGKSAKQKGKPSAKSTPAPAAKPPAGKSVPDEPTSKAIRPIKSGVGEIKHHVDSSIKDAKRQLSQNDRDRAGKAKRIVTYQQNPKDPNSAIVRMARLNKYGEVVDWVVVGEVPIKDLKNKNLSPGSKPFGDEIEGRVRDLVNVQTGGNVTNSGKNASTTGPDIIWKSKEYEFNRPHLRSSYRYSWLFEAPLI
jgi:hypothetical protein